MNVVMVVILVLAAVTATLAGVVHVLHGVNQALRKENARLEDEVSRQVRNIAYLVRHAQALAQIERDREKTFRRIEEARTDEEISNIVDAVISLNNERVQVHPKEGRENHAPADAGAGGA